MVPKKDVTAMVSDGIFEHTDLVRQLRLLGVRPGGTLVVHSCFRAVRPVLHGPKGLIEVLMDHGFTGSVKARGIVF